MVLCSRDRFLKSQNWQMPFSFLDSTKSISSICTTKSGYSKPRHVNIAFGTNFNCRLFKLQFWQVMLALKLPVWNGCNFCVPRAHKIYAQSKQGLMWYQSCAKEKLMSCRFEIPRVTCLLQFHNTGCVRTRWSPIATPEKRKKEEPVLRSNPR
jgi:hypothetical protein